MIELCWLSRFELTVGRTTILPPAAAAFFGAAFGPVVVLSLRWARMTRNGALAGMLTGAIVVLAWKQYGWFGLYEMVPGFVLATLAIIVVSLLGTAPAASIGERFARVREECAAAGC